MGVVGDWYQKFLNNVKIFQSATDKGSVRGAVLLPYSKTGETGNVMTRENLDEAIKSGASQRIQGRHGRP